MVKRCISLFLAMIVCFVWAPAVVLSAATNGKTDETLENLTYKIPVTDEYMEKVFGAPEEILNGSTEELLDYLLNSMFLASRTIPLASSDYVAERQKNADYTAHAAFRELLTRSDLTEVLANSVRDVFYEITTDEYMVEKLHNLVVHIPNEVIVSSAEADNGSSSANINITGYYHSSVIPGGILTVPEEILEGSTEELLNYFRETFTVWSGNLFHTVTFSSPISQEESLNYYNNGAFCELLTRADLGNALLKNLTDINDGYYVDTVLASQRNLLTSADEQIRLEKEKLKELVAHIPDTTIITSFANTNDELFESESALDTQSSIYVTTLNGVSYYTADPIITPNGNSVATMVAYGELIQSAYISYLLTATTLNVNITDYPTGVYNCHSYAWYNRSYGNDRWINDITGFLNDASCIQIADDYIRVGDIFVYYDEYMNILHSGVVTEITDNIEDLVITSKWGQGVACVHSVQNVPEEYLAASSMDRDNDGVIEENEVSYYVSGAFFRYAAASTSSTSSEPYTELDEVAEIVIALPASVSSVITGDEDSAD